MENNKNYDKFKELESDFKKIIMEMDKESKENNKTYRTFKVRGADQTINRNNRSVIIEGMDIAEYLKNPVIFINHESWDVLKIVGRATKVVKDLKKKEITFEGQFADTELGNMIADLYEDGFLKTVSLGYNVLERDETDPRICSKTNLYECSFVAIPANTNAEKMDSISQDKMDKLVELGIITKEEDVNLADSTEIKEEDNIEDKELTIADLNTKLDSIMALLSKDETEIKDETVKKEEENKDDIEKKVEKNEKIDILYSEEDLTDLFNMNISKLSLKK